MEEKEIQARIVSDEMNLAEFPLSSLSQRIPSGVTELVFEDVVEDRVTGDTHPAKIIIRGQEAYGLPTATDDEVLMACLAATAESGFKERKVRFKPRKMLLSMKWRATGPYYENLKRGLDRYSTISVESCGAYWHRGKKKPVRDIVSVIDRWQARGRDKITGLPEDAFFVWGDFYWESFRAGNLRNMDYEYWLNLDSAASRRAYRFLGKQFYRSDSVTYKLRPYAINKLGMSAKNPTGEIKRTLEKTHAELEAKNFCTAEYSGHGKNAKITYTALNTNAKVEEDPLSQALIKRGVRKTDGLVSAENRTRVERAIRNYDHRRAMGEKIGGGWLRDDITADNPYKYRDDYVSPESMAEKRKQSATAIASERNRVRRVLNEDKDAKDKEVLAYEKFVSELSDDEYEAFREEAIKRSVHRPTLRKRADSDKNYPVYLESAMMQQWRRSRK